MGKKPKVSKTKLSFHKQVKTHCHRVIQISDSDEEDIDQVVRLEISDSDDEDVQVYNDLTRTVDHNTPAGGNRNQRRHRNVVVEKKAESDDDDDVESDNNDMISEGIHPSFKLTLKEYQKSSVVVPKKFIDTAGFHKKKAVVLQYPPNQSLLPVLLVYHPSQDRFQMSAGWCKFRNNNGLEFNKTYIFEYVRDRNVIEVKLITTEENNNSSTLMRSWKFSKKLKKHNFTTARLYVPKCFVNGSGISKNREIKLEDAQGRKWPVRLTDDRNLGNFGITAGWKGFLDANKDVVVGTTILFEFIPNSGNVVRARIIKR